MNASANGANANALYPKEYSIFCGGLPPETSNSDSTTLLRNDRAEALPRVCELPERENHAGFFLPADGVSPGYALVRLTDDTDQQRAHGVYCLSRPALTKTAVRIPTICVRPQHVPRARRLSQHHTAPFSVSE
ncbi:hypothetical protein C8R45DRAFT_1024124 [Mycena sanguinolenta]|nr:hypothetical protein C8R45DRAFT_1024124 [Mycena sanguinolenta]